VLLGKRRVRKKTLCYCLCAIFLKIIGTWKYMCHFDTEDSIIVMCNKVENKLYRLKTQEKEKPY
jgi:hypothetical protein